MGDDFHRPTYTFPNMAYNATQVRLYGISLPPLLVSVNGGKEHRVEDFPIGSISIKIQSAIETDQTLGEAIADNKAAKHKAEELAKHLGIACGELNAVNLPAKVVYHLPVETKTTGVIVLVTSIDLLEGILTKFLSPAIVFGYAFEGHCYDMPKPKIMLLPDWPRPIPCDDCGYDDKSDHNYWLWITDKLDECVEIDVSQGFIEQLVLEANLPGKRSPTMYGGRMMMGHRSGKLNE